MTPPKASDAAIERVAERFGYSAHTYGRAHAQKFTAECDREQALSDALRAEHGDNVPASLAGFVLPVVVDPIVQMVREAFAADCEIMGELAGASLWRRGDWDDTRNFKIALSVARAIAAQGGGL